MIHALALLSGERRGAFIAIIRPGPGKTAREYPILRIPTMKKTLMILLAALMLGGKAFALSDEKIVEIWASEFYSAKKHGSSARI